MSGTHPNTIIPGAKPVADPSVIIQEVRAAPPVKETLKIERKRVSETQAKDEVLGNPHFTPWAVVLPYTRAFHIDLELHHALCFMRGPDSNTILAHAPVLWERHIVPGYPKIYSSTSEVVGEVHIIAMDENDWANAFLDVHRKHRADPAKYPLYALGGKVPFFFCAPWLEAKQTDFSFMRSWWSDNGLIGG